MRQATAEEARKLNASQEPKIVDDKQQWAGPVRVQTFQPLEIKTPMGRNMVWPEGVFSVTEEVAKALIRKGHQMRSFSRGPMAIRLEEEAAKPPEEEVKMDLKELKEQAELAAANLEVAEARLAEINAAIEARDAAEEKVDEQ